MRVDVSIARNAFHSLVRRAAEGESVVIVRHGKAIAKLRGFKKVEGVKLLSLDDLIAQIFGKEK
jgi:prevent-host-death family protein